MVGEKNEARNHGVGSNECPLNDQPQEGSGDPRLLSIWRKSAELYQPSCKNHLTSDFTAKKGLSSWKQSGDFGNDKEVLDAAEALTCLWRASLTKT